MFQDLYFNLPLTRKCFCCSQRDQSDARQVTLHKVDLNAEGRYACEVSADAPSFTTSMVEGRLTIVGEFRAAKQQIHDEQRENHAMVSGRRGGRQPCMWGA